MMAGHAPFLFNSHWAKRDPLWNASDQLFPVNCPVRVELIPGHEYELFMVHCTK